MEVCPPYRIPKPFVYVVVNSSETFFVFLSLDNTLLSLDNAPLSLDNALLSLDNGSFVGNLRVCHQKEREIDLR
jgi:hypothetical protein